MSVWQLINASSSMWVTHSGKWHSKCVNCCNDWPPRLLFHSPLSLFLVQHLRFGAMRMLQTAMPSDALRFVYGKTNTWLIEECASSTRVCVYVVCVVCVFWSLSVTHGWLSGSWLFKMQTCRRRRRRLRSNMHAQLVQFSSVGCQLPAPAPPPHMPPMSPWRTTYVSVMKFLPQIALNSSLKRAKSEWNWPQTVARLS